MARFALQEAGLRQLLRALETLAAEQAGKRLATTMPRPSSSSSTTAAARAGMTPTMERTFTGTWDPVGGDQPVVEEAIGVVPQALGVDGLADGREVLDELEHQVEPGPLAAAVQDGRHGGHGQGIRRHPPRGVGLLQRAADGKVGAVDRPDIVQPQEAALEEVVALLVLEVDPPREVDEELVEDPAEKVDVATTVDGEDLESGPGLHGRVDIPEIPLVGGRAPLGCWNHSRHRRISWYLANAGSTCARATQ